MAAEDMVKLWEEHVIGEFVEKDEELSLSTMVEDASVMHMPTRSGGKGKTELRTYYRDMFIPSIPAEWEHTMTNRVVTEDYRRRSHNPYGPFEADGLVPARDSSDRQDRHCGISYYH